VRDFVAAVAAGGTLKPDFADGLANQRVLDAIERSSASRRWERV
jgi:predicted dehydrogenase